MTTDERYMKEAVRQAKKASALGEVPIGCVIVYEDKIIARGYNRRMVDQNVLSHAEIIAIRKACKKMGDWRLENCTLYVTLEPCPMCAGAIVQARPELVVFGAFDGELGGMGSVYAMHCDERIRGNVPVIGGVRRAECEAVMKRFFETVRREK